MKKFIMLFTIIPVMLCCLSAQVYADSTVTTVIPDYPIIIDNASVYYADSLYPFLNYKGVTYLPMTYQYARAMNLTTDWLEGTGFMVANQPSGAKLPKYTTTSNPKYNSVIVPTGYNIYVNGEKINNAEAEYPLLNFRGVTYFPLSWEYAVEKFGWKISFDKRVLKIVTENNTDRRWNIEEKRKNDVILSLNYSKEVPLKDGNVSYDHITEFYSLDLNNGKLIELNDYNLSESVITNNELEVTVEDGYVYCNGVKLEDVYVKEASKDYVKPDDVEKTEYTVSAIKSSVYDPLDVVNVNVYIYNYGKNADWGRSENYTLIKVNDKFVSLGSNCIVENVYELNGDIYFNTMDYVKTIFMHFLQNRKLWKLSESGELKQISYAEFNTIKVIGKAGGKLYLKCMWSPENPMDESPYSVNLINDGYYIFDGKAIKLVSPYIYSDFDILTANGDIYAVDNVLGKIIKCKMNEEK